MNLGDFHDLVVEELKRGDSMTAMVPRRAEMAGRYLERNWTFQYMKVWQQVTLNPDDPNSNLIDFQSDLKALPWMRIPAASGDYQYLREVNPRDLLRPFPPGLPCARWKSGRSAIVLDRKPDNAYIVEGESVIYSSWPTNEPATHWLLTNGPDLLLAQTMLHFARYLRNADMAALYGQLRGEALAAMVLADQAEQFEGTDASMGYHSIYG